MPLTEKVCFKTLVQRGNRMQINRHIRWRYKLEPNQILSVHVNIPAIWMAQDSFLCTMTKDGRIVIPKLTAAILSKQKYNLHDYLAEVTLKPF